MFELVEEIKTKLHLGDKDQDRPRQARGYVLCVVLF
jgi:hypothetical protein